MKRDIKNNHSLQFSSLLGKVGMVRSTSFRPHPDSLSEGEGHVAGKWGEAVGTTPFSFGEGSGMRPNLGKGFLLLLTVGLLFFSSCQKVVNIDLNSAAPQIVIEANVSDQLVPDTVKLTQTVNFSDQNTFPPITNATVTISDNQGNTETLSQVKDGIYVTHTLQGVPGRTYSLAVTASGKTYNAICTMAQPVNIDSLSAVKGVFGKRLHEQVIFKDTVGAVIHYYRLVEVINRKLSTGIYITDDQLINNNQITANLNSDQDSLRTGDSVTVQLWAIDKNVFNYFRDILQLGDGQNASPANPESNISNGALGYFSAYAVRQRSMVVK